MEILFTSELGLRAASFGDNDRIWRRRDMAFTIITSAGSTDKDLLEIWDHQHFQAGPPVSAIVVEVVDTLDLKFRAI